MKKSIALITLAMVAALALSLIGCGSPTSKADKLYEEKNYKEALAEYQALNSSDDEIQKKIDDCNFWVFIDYVRDKGSISINGKGGDKETTKIEAGEDGTITLSYSSSLVSSSDEKFKMVISHDTKVAPVTASDVTRVSKAARKQTAKGTLDIGTYKYGDKLDWDERNDEAGSIYGTNLSNMVTFSLDYNSRALETMVQALGSAIDQSVNDGNTGCTLKTIGFDKLD